MILDESVRELMAKVGHETAVNQLQEKIRNLQWELHALTGQNPPVIELQRLRREAGHLKRIIGLQNRLITKLRGKGRLYEMDELECDILNELAQMDG